MVDSVGFSTNQVLAAQLARQAIQAQAQSVGTITPQTAEGGGHGQPRGHTQAAQIPNHNSGLKGEKPDRMDVPRGHHLDIRV